MGKVIFNSDDFGYSRGVNYGILDAYNKGILTSTTLMANMPGFTHAVELKKENPGLGVGVHLTLTCGKPILNNVKTLMDEENFKHVSFYKEGFKINAEELYLEWDAQIQKVYKSGIVPTHLDSHHHCHTFGNNYKVIESLARKYKLPVRCNYKMSDGIKGATRFESYFDDVGALSESDSQNDTPLEIYLEELLEKLRIEPVTEVMCHTAYLDDKLLSTSSFTLPRVKQVEFLISSDFANRIREDKAIQLITYNDLEDKNNDEF